MDEKERQTQLEYILFIYKVKYLEVTTCFGSPH